MIEEDLSWLVGWYDWVLWHVNHFWLFNAKSYLHIYIEYKFVNILKIRAIKASNSSI